MDVTTLEKNLASTEWRLNNLYKIIDKSGKQIPFRMNDAQLQLLALISQGYKKILTVKARQQGFSTLLGIYALDLCLFKNHQTTAILADTHENCLKLFKKVKKTLDYLIIDYPEFKFQDQIQECNTTTLALSNGSTLTAVTRLRSQTYNFVHFSEVAKIADDSADKFNEVLNGGLPAVGDNLAVIESTFEGGKSSPMYPLLKEAKNNTDNNNPDKQAFHLLFLPFYLQLEYVDHSDERLQDWVVEYFRNCNVQIASEQMLFWQKKYAILNENTYNEYPTVFEDIIRSSTQGSIYENQLIKLKTEHRYTSFNVDKSQRINVALDIGFNDTTALTFFQTMGNRVFIIDYYENRQEHISHYISIIAQRYQQVLGTVILPHDARNNTVASVESVEATMKKAFNDVIVLNRTLDIWSDINEVRAKFDNIYINSFKCEKLLSSLENYRKKYNKIQGCFIDEILHDENSNGADSFRYALMFICKQFNLINRTAKHITNHTGLLSEQNRQVTVGRKRLPTINNITR